MIRTATRSPRRPGDGDGGVGEPVRSTGRHLTGHTEAGGQPRRALGELERPAGGGAAREGQRTYPYDADLREIEGLVLRRLGDFDAAEEAMHEAFAAAMASAEAAEADGDPSRALRTYEQLAQNKVTVNEDVLSRVARTALAAACALLAACSGPPAPVHRERRTER